MSTDFFSSLNGKFDYTASMSGLLGDYSELKSGAYGSLLKSYVGKVGNKAALNAYRSTGSTATGYESSETETVKKSKVTHKTNFLDTVGKSTTTQKETETKKETASADTSTDTAKVTTDKYQKLKSSWLDDQLKQYDKDANKTTAADTSVSYDTTV